ncbi:unnamed protein product [Lactuca saligna]|uniref:Uncharacterized protein n=1 Tax=Lactuca saligna TaxID=75948 RepID=A0AA36A467_LACSI|nr:unnamed protein product [Lactuca saligna]
MVIIEFNLKKHSKSKVERVNIRLKQARPPPALLSPTAASLTLKLESTAPNIDGEDAANDEEQHEDASSGLSLPSSGEMSNVRHCARRGCGYEVLGAAGGFTPPLLVFPIVGIPRTTTATVNHRVFGCVLALVSRIYHPADGVESARLQQV